LARGRVQLAAGQRARALGGVLLGDRKGGFAPLELLGTRVELGLALVELGGAFTQDLLDAPVELAGALLAALEVVHREEELLGALLELAAVYGDQRFDRVAGVGRREEVAEPA